MVGNEHPAGIEREAAKKWGVTDSVRFCGPQRDVLPFLWAADAFLMPSKYEGFGLSAVEALATGIPCVFSDCPGLRDFRDFPFQIAWSGCDAPSIAAAVSPLMTQAASTLRQEDTAAAVRQEFSVERRSAEYARLWNAAAGKS
jgi:glycosyltransferase involved in cell wall biosynthesis